MLIFGVGGAISVYGGILHVRAPHPMTDPRVNYIVIAIAAAIEGVSWTFAVKGFYREKGTRSPWQQVRASKDPTTFAVLFEDSAALIGLGIAAGGIYLSERLDQPVYDGVASILIGLLLCAVATVLLRETKNLLIGEAALPSVIDAIRRRTAEIPM